MKRRVGGGLMHAAPAAATNGGSTGLLPMTMTTTSSSSPRRKQQSSRKTSLRTTTTISSLLQQPCAVLVLMLIGILLLVLLISTPVMFFVLPRLEDHDTTISTTSRIVIGSSSGVGEIEYSYYYPKLRKIQSTKEAQDLIIKKKKSHTKSVGGSSGGKGHESNNSNNDNNNIIHIVHTRFMQDQGNLTALGNARLGLFRIFCLPTMVQQTSQNFIWIIKTDPNLDESIFRELVTLIQPYPNYYVVKSNSNFRINKYSPRGGWRDYGEPEELTSARIYTGDQSQLETTMSLANHVDVLLETRLDADDGLHLKFVDSIQRNAVSQFSIQIGDDDEMGKVSSSRHRRPPKWMYWCIPRNMEWHWIDNINNNNTTATTTTTTTSDDKNVNANNNNNYYGALAATKFDNLCITAGITVGYGLETKQVDVPIFAHDKIVVTLRGGGGGGSGETTANSNNVTCGLDKTADCLQFVEEFAFGAIRSRTPTSAGMWNVLLPPEHSQAPNSFLNYALWDQLHKSFGLSRQPMKWMNTYLSEHLIDIARENLIGQCTKGHSCKEKARKSLQELIEARKNFTTTTTTG